MADPIRDLWNRIRGIGRVVEEELYDFTEEEEEHAEEEPRGRNTLIALLNAFMTLWKTNQASVGERTLGLAGFAGLLWLIVGDRGLGVRKPPLRIASTSFAVIWFVPGMIAAVWTLVFNLGAGSLRHWRTWPLVLVFAAGGLISFRAVFSDLARRRLHPVPRKHRPSERP